MKITVQKRTSGTVVFHLAPWYVFSRTLNNPPLCRRFEHHEQDSYADGSGPRLDLSPEQECGPGVLKMRQITNRITREACRSYGITAAEFYEHNRIPACEDARFAVAWALRIGFKCPLRGIGRLLYRDANGTVLNMVRRAIARRSKCNAFLSLTDKLIR